jgi:hypothetical protein
MLSAGSCRTIEEVFAEHLRLRQAGNLDEDLRRNYSVDIVLLCSTGIVRGHEGVGHSAGRLADQLPNASFEFVTSLVADGCAFLEWRARSDRFIVCDGADSFFFRNGKIAVQTIHYTLSTASPADAAKRDSNPVAGPRDGR